MPGLSNGADVGDEVEGSLGMLRCGSGHVGIAVPLTDTGTREEQVKGEGGHVHLLQGPPACGLESRERGWRPAEPGLETKTLVGRGDHPGSSRSEGRANCEWKLGEPHIWEKEPKMKVRVN